MFENVLTLKALGLLSKLASPLKKGGFYLAGGTGLALQIGHRISEDFDFFKGTSFDPNQLLSELKVLADSMENVIAEAGTLYVNLEGIRFSFLYYDIPLLFEGSIFYDVKIADWRDIITEKIKAISQRGSKKDFYDVFYVLNSKLINIEEIVSLFKKKFGPTGINFYHVLRSLTYFEDAAEDPDPVIIGEAPFNWNEVVSFFKRKIHQFEKAF